MDSTKEFDREAFELVNEAAPDALSGLVRVIRNGAPIEPMKEGFRGYFHEQGAPEEFVMVMCGCLNHIERGLA